MNESPKEVSRLNRSVLQKFVNPVTLLLGMGVAAWIIGYSYVLDTTLFFYDGLLGAVAVLLLAKRYWKGSASVNIWANTLVLLITLLPLADGALQLMEALAQRQASRLPPGAKIYSFEEARANPALFAAWWDQFGKEWRRLSEEITMDDPDRKLPFKFKPGSSGYFFDSFLSINSLGFRDEEFEFDKKDKYRIIALGESTTMGVPLSSESRPWPKVLQDLIGKKFNCARPVQVINAGVAAYTLQDNVVRLKEELLQLKPDMIISYHGYNGFHFLDSALTDLLDYSALKRPPPFKLRPSKLLARVEYRFKMLKYRRTYVEHSTQPETIAQLRQTVLESPSAALHNELIGIARTNRIKVVLLSYNMAVNNDSPEDVVGFYSGGFPDVAYRMQANQLQTYLLEELAKRNPDVLYIDTSRDLDAVHEKYMDLVHLTQPGKNQLAENVFNGIKSYLAQEERLRCEAKDTSSNQASRETGSGGDGKR